MRVDNCWTRLSLRPKRYLSDGKFIQDIKDRKETLTDIEKQKLYRVSGPSRT